MPPWTGRPSSATPLGIFVIGALPADRAPWLTGGPVDSKAAVITGAWWLCREIELSTLRARLAEFSWSSGRWKVTLHLPASKTDQLAQGVSRSLLCMCTEFGKHGCPACVLVDHVLHLQQLFPSRWEDDLAVFDLPLFPTIEGTVVSKSAMRSTIEHATQLQGIPLSAPDQSERITGHSLRVTGAQGLTRLGWHLWAVQLHGRWGSDVVLRYVREAPPGRGIVPSA